MKRDEPSNRVRLAATNALLNSLEFTRSNFDAEVCTHVITIIKNILNIYFDIFDP